MKAVHNLTSLLSLLLLFTQVELSLQNTATGIYNKDFCLKKVDGNYADPVDCRAFYQCSNGITTHRLGNANTPNLMFDPKAGKYDYSGYVDCGIRKVFREIYTNIPGSRVLDLENHVKFPCNPSTTVFLDTFCTYHLTTGNLFGQRLRSFFRAPETGEYEFQSSCDDSCKVYLSTNNKPENKKLIIDQQQRSGMLSWENDDQASKPVKLVANQVYYMEALHKDGSVTNDFICIGMKYSGKIERPISSRHLVLDEEGVSRLGCTGSVTTGIKNCQECSQPYTVKDLKKLLSRMKNVVKSTQIKEEYHNATKQCATGVDNVLDKMPSTAEGMKISWLLEDFGRSAATHWNRSMGEISLSLPNLAISLRNFKNGYRFPDGPDASFNWRNAGDFIELKTTNSNETANVFSVIYKSLDKFLPTAEVTAHDSNSSSNYLELNSRIISSVLTRVSSSLKVDVIVQLAHLKVYKNDTIKETVCVWWDYSAGGNNEGKWSTEGCVNEKSNQTHTICRCSHLTNFAVLMQLKPVKIGAKHKDALEIITYVGCGLSILGIAITVLILGCLSGLRSERNLIHLNLSLSIGILQIIFLAGVKATENKVGCTIVAILLHYFCLASFSWMLVEGVYLYTMVIKVFDSDKERFKYYLATAYSLPALIVLIAAASVQLNGYGTDMSCWLTYKKGLIYAFVAPALAIVLINTIILTMVIIEIVKIQANSYIDNGKLLLLRSGVKSVIILLPLLGLTWVFGVLTLSQDTLVFQYLFAICNSLQGLFLFVFHCLLNTEVRKAIKRKKEIWNSRKTGSAPSTSFIPSSWRKVQTNVSVDALDILGVAEDQKSNQTSSNLRCSNESLDLKTGKQSPKLNRLKTYNDTGNDPKAEVTLKASPTWEQA